MAAILNYIKEQSVFEPDEIHLMSRAYEEACTALNVFAGDKGGREAIAARVIDLARGGIIDSKALSERVVAEAKALRAL
jgi:Holliday junction resolvasome RuvABC ATP-dependent DNA helicase subunit